MAREDDFELVRQMCSGDADLANRALSEIYEKYNGRVYNTAYRILGDRDLAADVTQETFIAILRKASKFRFRAAFSSWLYRVAVNLCIDTRRKVNRRRPLSLSEPDVESWVEEEDSPLRPENPGPMEIAGRAELHQEMARAIARLNPRLAVVVVLRYVEGLGYEEIAEVLVMPLGTVKSRLNRAHAALEADLGPKLDQYL